MDKAELERRFVEACSQMGLGVPASSLGSLAWLQDELLRWNSKVNLTAVTEAAEVLEKHFLDSLAVLPDVEGENLLDIGSGAGFPGLPLALVLPGVQATLVDAVGKKVGFIKHAAARLGLSTRVRATQARLAGRPEEEGLGTFDVVVSRALMDVGPWLLLASAYVRPQGRVLAMVAHPPERSVLEAQAGAAGLEYVGARHYALPWSGAPRAVLRFARPG